MRKITATYARKNLAAVLDQVASRGKIVQIQRRGKEAVAMIAAKELSSLLETVHLLKSPANAQRLFTALRRSQAK